MIKIFLKKLKAFNWGIAVLVTTILLSNVSNILAQEQDDFETDNVSTEYKFENIDEKNSSYDDEKKAKLAYIIKNVWKGMLLCFVILLVIIGYKAYKNKYKQQNRFNRVDNTIDANENNGNYKRDINNNVNDNNSSNNDNIVNGNNDNDVNNNFNARDNFHINQIPNVAGNNNNLLGNINLHASNVWAKRNLNNKNDNNRNNINNRNSNNNVIEKYRNDRKNNEKIIERAKSYESITYASSTQYATEAIKKKGNTFQGILDVTENTISSEPNNLLFIKNNEANLKVLKINFWGSKDKGRITILYDGRSENIYSENLENYKINVGKKKILAKNNGSSEGVLVVETNIDKVTKHCNTKYTLTLDEYGNIIRVEYVYFLRGNGVCACSTGPFLYMASRVKNFDELLSTEKIDECLQKGITLYKKDFAKDAKAGKATDIMNVLKKCNLEVDPSVLYCAQDGRLEFNFVNPKARATSLEQVKNILKERIQNNRKMQLASLKDGPESWGLLYQNGNWYIYDPHGKPGLKGSPCSMIIKFSSIDQVSNFIWEHSSLKGGAGNENRGLLVNNLGNIYFYWLENK